MATSMDDIKSPLFWRAVSAELVGTMFLTLVGCGSCIGWYKVMFCAFVKLMNAEKKTMNIKDK